MEWIEQLSQQDKNVKREGEESKGKKLAIISLSSIPLVMTLGNSMLIPVLPTMERELAISSFQSSMIITVYSIVAIILIPIAGYLSDRIGRKKVIIPSLILAAIGGLVSGWAAWKMDHSYMFILIGRMLQGAGAAGAAPIVLPLVGDLYKNESEMSSCLGTIETANTFGKVLSPILGAFLAGVSWFFPFFSFPIFCAISIALMLFFIKTPRKSQEPMPFKQFLHEMKGIFQREGRWLYAIFMIGGILMFALFGVLFFLSSMLESRHHMDGVKKGFALALPLGALCIASFLTGKKIEKNKLLMKWLTFAGVSLLAIATFLLSFFENIWLQLTIFFLSGIGIGVALPCLDALITEGIEKKERGTITSIYSSMRFIGVASGPPVVALLMKKSTDMMFYVLAGLCVLASVVIVAGIKPSKKGENA
ncbi:MFS transporter [Anoxybacillus rupiensis]|jgi:MFS transporter, ACDE family, multidrug resistance protein|uniref:MFS transporter n=1 Tax=Anoxybacteroides rupiense TaxID=311460 RepID=A0ABT5W4R9_9BACL|nr:MULTISPECIES: MFS transporter [Anoxybacillus]MBS2770599.1 MFS transporter [Anoxybacillus rupiensis]MDE8564315.1 MFS transporter [Anoxybacillus rupiensis]QHC03458.1 MFS transporter [Anoxybacillus sp. PDR2]